MHILENAVITFSTEDPDDFIFEITQGENILMLQSSNLYDLRIWVRFLKIAINEDCEKESVKKGYLLCKENNNSEFQKKWFVLSRNQLQYFQDETEENFIGIISIENLTINENDHNNELQFEVNSKKVKNIRMTLQAPTIDEKNFWLTSLEKSKLQFWNYQFEMPILKRGYLVKYHKNFTRGCYRWFVLTDTFLLYFKHPKVLSSLLIFYYYYYYYYY